LYEFKLSLHSAHLGILFESKVFGLCEGLTFLVLLALDFDESLNLLKGSCLSIFLTPDAKLLTSSSNDEDLEEVDMGTNNWTEPDHDLFNVYNPTPESVRVKHSPTSGLLTDFNSKYSTFPGQGYSNFASGVRKIERQEPFSHCTQHILEYSLRVKSLVSVKD
jgi:hypothetical protein